MNGLKSSKYMEIFTNFGYILGFGIIILFVIIKQQPIYLPVAVIVIFILRLIGYGIDRINELKK